MSNIFELNLHEVASIDCDSRVEVEVIRVYGGFIYNMYDYYLVDNEWILKTSTFVPYSKKQ
jgi:hypothetical protein